MVYKFLFTRQIKSNFPFLNHYVHFSSNFKSLVIDILVLVHKTQAIFEARKHITFSQAFLQILILILIPMSKAFMIG